MPAAVLDADALRARNLAHWSAADARAGSGVPATERRCRAQLAAAPNLVAIALRRGGRECAGRGFAVLLFALAGFAPVRRRQRLWVRRTGPGCLGVTIDQCVGWLRATMRARRELSGGALAQRHQVDVNGRPLGSGLVTVNAKLPDRLDQFVILLHLRPDDTVARVEFEPADQPDRRAHRTGLRPERVLRHRLAPARAALRRIAKLDLYRFFENAVKPRIRQEQQGPGERALGPAPAGVARRRGAVLRHQLSATPT